MSAKVRTIGVEEAKTEGAKRAVFKALNAFFPPVRATLRAKWRTVMAENMVGKSYWCYCKEILVIYIEDRIVIGSDV